MFFLLISKTRTILANFADVTSLTELYVDGKFHLYKKRTFYETKRYNPSFFVAVSFSHFTPGNKLTGTLPDDLCTEKINADFYDYNPGFYQTNPKSTRDFCQSIACPTGFYSTEGIWPCEACPAGFFNPYVSVLPVISKDCLFADNPSF